MISDPTTSSHVNRLDTNRMKRSTQMSLQKFIFLSCQISVRHKNIPTYASGSTRIQQHHRKKILETNKRSIPHTHTQEVHKFYFALAQVFGEKIHTPQQHHRHTCSRPTKRRNPHTHDLHKFTVLSCLILVKNPHIPPKVRSEQTN